MALSHFNMKSLHFLLKTYSKSNYLISLSSSLPKTDLTSCRYMAGHAKWQNIAHVKAAKDREKNQLYSRYAHLVLTAAKEGGPDPKSNNKLARLLEEGRKNNVPNATMEGALKKAFNKKTKPGFMEILGPGGALIILEYETDNVSVARQQYKIMCKKHKVNILTGEGRWRAAYEQKGLVKVVARIDGQDLNSEKALDVAIEAGAEEVNVKQDENEKTYHEFVCSPDDMHPAKKELEKEYRVEEAYIGYIPITKVELSKEDMIALDEFLEELENYVDTVRIYENVQ